ncbi:MAG TPA: NfeD family protein [Solirubrobacterales bacterium]|jgi:membrane-bound serine protease (ClpP class)
MDAYVVVALIGIGLLLAELLLPTGGFLAFLGAAGLVVGGILALTADSNSSLSDVAGPALITLGLLSVVTFYFVGRKVVRAQQEGPRPGGSELIGLSAEARTTLDPIGRVWVEGTLWSARLVDEGRTLRPGDRVTVEGMDGLTLLVRPESRPATEEGAD